MGYAELYLHNKGEMIVTKNNEYYENENMECKYR